MAFRSCFIEPIPPLGAARQRFTDRFCPGERYIYHGRYIPLGRFPRESSRWIAVPAAVECFCTDVTYDAHYSDDDTVEALICWEDRCETINVGMDWLRWMVKSPEPLNFQI